MFKTNKATANSLSAGVVIVRFWEDVPYYLLLRVFSYWDFPKGLVEKGEEPLEAAVREVEEETTLNDLFFHWGYDFRETRPYGKYKKIARYYLAESREGEVDLPVSRELGHPEHHEYRWVTFAEAKDMVAERVKPILDWAHGRIISGGERKTGRQRI
ncbi:MAG: NUDIX domain-containing protein [Desulfurivibrionaceae bacterium]